MSNSNPVVLGKGGLIPDIFLDEDYRVVVQNKDGVQIYSGININPASLGFYSGNDIASASTIDLDAATGSRVHITGTTTISSVTLARGPITLIFDDALTLEHNATTNKLPGSANITTAAGDLAVYESDGTTVYCRFFPVSGGAVVSSSASKVEITTASASADSTIDFTLSGTYAKYTIDVHDLIASSDGRLLGIQVSDDNASTYETSGYVSQVHTGSDSSSSAAGYSTTYIRTSDLTFGNASNEKVSGEITVVRPHDGSKTTMIYGHICYKTTAGLRAVSSFYGECLNTTSAITNIRLLLDSGTITTGEFILNGENAE